MSHPAASAVIGKDVINCQAGKHTLHDEQNAVSEVNGNRLVVSSYFKWVMMPLIESCALLTNRLRPRTGG